MEREDSSGGQDRWMPRLGCVCADSMFKARAWGEDLAQSVAVLAGSLRLPTLKQLGVVHTSHKNQTRQSRCC